MQKLYRLGGRFSHLYANGISVLLYMAQEKVLESRQHTPVRKSTPPVFEEVDISNHRRAPMFLAIAIPHGDIMG